MKRLCFSLFGKSNFLYYYQSYVILLRGSLPMISQGVHYCLDYFFTGFIFVLPDNLL